jgi:hypothetical protein
MICIQKKIDDVQRSLAASKINWTMVEKWRKQLNYKSNEDMLIDWMFDKQEVYRRGLIRKPNPFHKHIRNSLDNMENLGVSSMDMVIDQGLMLTKEQIAEYKEAIEDYNNE